MEISRKLFLSFFSTSSAMTRLPSLLFFVLGFTAVSSIHSLLLCSIACSQSFLMCFVLVYLMIYEKRLICFSFIEVVINRNYESASCDPKKASSRGFPLIPSVQCHNYPGTIEWILEESTKLQDL